MTIKTKDFQYECASAEQHSDGLHLLDENGEVTLILNAKVVEVIGGEIEIIDSTETTDDVLNALLGVE